jgi:hypothetical protein
LALIDEARCSLTGWRATVAGDRRRQAGVKTARASLDELLEGTRQEDIAAAE